MEEQSIWIKVNCQVVYASNMGVGVGGSFNGESCNAQLPDAALRLLIASVIASLRAHKHAVIGKE